MRILSLNLCKYRNLLEEMSSNLRNCGFNAGNQLLLSKMIVSRDTQGHTTLFHARMPEAFKDRRL
jgi:hypothetical protein